MKIKYVIKFIISFLYTMKNIWKILFIKKNCENDNFCVVEIFKSESLQIRIYKISKLTDVDLEINFEI